MSVDLGLAVFFAALIYVVTPGPAVLVLLTLIAQRGRMQGALFMLGHLVGDCVWGALALAAIVGVSSIGPLLFDILGLGCGLFLIYLGLRAVLSRTESGKAVLGDKRPIAAGLAFGLTNPKAYPVSLAVFTALVSRYALNLTWADGPMLFALAFLGFLGGNAIILVLAGLKPVRTFMLSHGLWVTRIVGVTFILFGLKSLYDALSHMIARG